MSVALRSQLRLLIVVAGCGAHSINTVDLGSPSYVHNGQRIYVTIKTPSSLEAGHYEPCARKGDPAAQYDMPVVDYFLHHVLKNPVPWLVSTYVADDDDHATGAAIESLTRSGPGDRRAVFVADLRSEQGEIFVGEGTRQESYCVRPHADAAHNAIVLEADLYSITAQ